VMYPSDKHDPKGQVPESLSKPEGQQARSLKYVTELSKRCKAGGAEGRAGGWMTSSPVQHAAAVPGAAAATGDKTGEQLPVAAQALQPSMPAPASLSRASNGISNSIYATARSIQHDPTISVSVSDELLLLHACF